MQFSYGCDPEVFLFTDKNEFVSAHGMFPGTKNEPYKVDKGAIQVDGLALEFNIDPAKTANEFNSNITTVLKQMKDMVSKADKSLNIKFTPYVQINRDYFNSLPEEAKVLGCDPDFRASDGNQIVMPENQGNNPIRTASGHAHIGWTENQDPHEPAHFEDCRFIAQHFMGIGEYNIYPNGNSRLEYDRLKYYGHSGAFRPKPYGVELRKFSNRWVEEEDTRFRMFNFLDKNIKSLYKG